MNVVVHRVAAAAQAAPSAAAAAKRAYLESSAQAVLIAQQVVGIKSFQEQSER
jgi:hypothetical protein